MTNKNEAYDYADDVRYLEDFGLPAPPPPDAEFTTRKDVDEWFLVECRRPLIEDDIPF